MKTVIIGAGRGCQAILELLDAGRLREMQMDVVCVCDSRPDAPGLGYAREHGRQILTDYREALATPDLELILELTGDIDILADIYHRLPAGIRVIDHASARLFWDVISIEQSLREELEARTVLERKLETDRQKTQHILDSMPDIVFVLDPQKRILQANARFSEASGVSIEDAVGRSCGEVFCTADKQPDLTQHGCPFDRAVTRKEPAASVVERLYPNLAFYEVTACPIYDENGKLLHVIETHHPVTKRIRLQRKVERSEHLLRQFIDSAHDIISIKDKEGRYIIYNPASASLFSKDPLEFIGKTAQEIYEPDIAKTIIEHDHEVMTTGEYRTYTEHYFIEGQEYYLRTVRFPIRDYHGNIEGVATIARDVTQERNLQQQLLQSAKLAAIGKLAAGVAHEINNPLTGVLAYAEDLLEDAEPGDERREDYEVIIRETLRCRDIVRDLLDFARQDDPDIQTIDLNEVMIRSLTLVVKLPRFHDIDIECRLADHPLPVNADSRQLQQVFLNLIINASDAMNRKGHIDITSRGTEDGRCLVSIQDTGPGVPEDMRDRIFEPFFSTKSTSGLGLAVTWGIVERHGGTIEVGDRPAGGADFRVILPAAASDS